MNKKSFTLTAGLAFLFATPVASFSQSHMFIDESGNIHHVEQARQVPSRYKGQVFGNQQIELDRRDQERIYRKYQQEQAKRLEASLFPKNNSKGNGSQGKEQRRLEKERKKAMRAQEKALRQARKLQRKSLKRGVNKAGAKTEKVKVEDIAVAPPADAVQAE